MARPIIERGPEITPHRRAVIVAYQMLNQPLSYNAIKAKIGVAESTASSIFRHAVQNATVKQEKKKNLPMLVPPTAIAELELDEFLAEINAKLQALQITNDTTSSTGTGTTQDSGPLPIPVTPAEFSLLELISKDCLDPDARLGRPKALSKEKKDRLVATVKRDFETQRMKLVDLRREAGLAHVCNTTVYNALRERGISAYQEEFKFILTSEGKALHLAYCTARKAWRVDKEWSNYGFTNEMSIEIDAMYGEF